MNQENLLLYAITDRELILQHHSDKLKNICDSKQQKNDNMTHVSENEINWQEELEILAAQVEKALQSGVTMLQFREKNLTPDKRKEEALLLQKLCKFYGVPLIINDFVELAKEIGADGVHVGQSDCSVQKARELLGADFIIGATAKTVEQAKTAQEQGADYLGSGAVFGSTTKLDAKPMNHDLLEDICNSVSIPVVAIGGITLDNVQKLAGRSITGVAVIGGIFGQEDVKDATKELKQKVIEMLENVKEND